MGQRTSVRREMRFIVVRRLPLLPTLCNDAFRSFGIFDVLQTRIHAEIDLWYCCKHGYTVCDVSFVWRGLLMGDFEMVGELVECLLRVDGLLLLSLAWATANLEVLLNVGQPTVAMSDD